MPTKDGKMTPAEGRARARKYEKDKAKVKAFEAKNGGYLVAFKSTGKGNWYKMAGFSAKAWVDVLAPRLEISAKFNPDTDFHSKFLDGIVSLRNIGVFAENMTKLGAKEVKPAKLCDDTDDVRVWDVRKLVNREDVTRMRRAKKEEKELLNKIVIPKTVLPELHTRATDVMKIIHSMLTEMTPRDAELIGMEVGRGGMRLYGLSFRMANEGLAKAEGLKKMQEEIEFLLRSLYLCTELKVCSIKRALRASSILTEMSTHIAKMQKAAEHGAA